MADKKPINFDALTDGQVTLDTEWYSQRPGGGEADGNYKATLRQIKERFEAEGLTLGGVSVSSITINPNLFGASNNELPTALAVKSYVDNNAGGGAFSTSLNVTSNTDGTLAADDFVFGSDQLDDANDVNKDSRIIFDKSKSYFAAGKADSTQWDDASRGEGASNIGVNNIASGPNSLATGTYAEAFLRGQEAHAAGRFGSVDGSAQVQQFVGRREETGTGTYDLFLDGISERMVIPNNTIWVGRWDCSIVAMNSAGDVSAGDMYSESGYVIAKNIGGTITVTAPTEFTHSDVSMNTSSILLAADTPNNALRVLINVDDGGSTTLETRSVFRVDVTQTKY